MRGVIVFMTALFMLAPYYILMTMLFEPLIRIVTSYDLTALSGGTTIPILQDIMFIYGPFIYLAGWLLWAVRYYTSQELFVGEVR